MSTQNHRKIVKRLTLYLKVQVYLTITYTKSHILIIRQSCEDINKSPSAQGESPEKQNEDSQREDEDYEDEEVRKPLQKI